MIRKYPDHFYEPIRIKIAISQMRHDFRKLFPSISFKEWERIDKDISGWFEGEKFELEPVHAFWNFFGGLTRGLKLKSLTSWVTAINVDWTRQEVPVKDIVITWDFPGIEFMGKAPYRAHDVINKLNQRDMKIFKLELEKDSDMRSKRFAPRDQFPIILFYDPKGGVISDFKGYYILEGNRRTMRAIVKDTPNITAYVGKFKNSDDLWPQNYWVETGILRDLIFLAINYEKEKDEQGFSVVRKMYQLLLRDFDIARVATFDKSFKTFETSERLRHEILMEDLK